MKKILKHTIHLALVLAIGLTACQKADLKPPARSLDLRFILQPSSFATPDLSLVVSIRNSAGQEIMSDRRLPLTLNGKYVSETLSLQAGNYRVTKYLVADNKGDIIYATPVAGSEKAKEIRKPLDLAFSMPGAAVQELMPEILAVVPGDKAEAFGYPAGSFSKLAEDQEKTLSIKLQAVIGIGSIIYDSIPAQVSILSWDANNNVHRKDTLLAPGINSIRLPASHTRYQFSMSKWGITDEITLTRDRIQENVVFTLGGSRAARKLRREETFLFVMGSYQPSSKAIYSYGTKGLSAVEYYQKKPQWSDLQFTFRHQYQYSGSMVKRIELYDSSNTMKGFTDLTYNDQGTKITHMHQKVYDVETFAAVEHRYPEGAAEITIDYLYNNGNAMEYKMRIKGGNKVEDRATASTGSSEGGTYSYDQAINPYAHMNMPDIYLSNLSKNNLLTQQKNYGGSIPSAELYKLEYSYDNDGYPTEVLKYYKNYRTGEHLYHTKTVFTYM